VSVELAVERNDGTARERHRSTCVAACRQARLRIDGVRAERADGDLRVPHRIASHPPTSDVDAALSSCASRLDSGKYLQHVSRRVVCRLGQFRRSPVCSKDEAFRENTDTKLSEQWSQLLKSIVGLAVGERTAMRVKALKHGVHEIYRQASMFAADYVQVRDFRKNLENKYGRDARSRKGNEIIFTTAQLLDSRRSCEPTTTLSSPTDGMQRCVSASRAPTDAR
jgi:hypothetical protein